MIGRCGWRRVAVTRRLLVNLKSGDAIDGVLLRQSGNVLVFGAAEHYAASGRSPVPMQGEVIIDRDNIAYAQVLPPKMSPMVPATSSDE